MPGFARRGPVLLVLCVNLVLGALLCCVIRNYKFSGLTRFHPVFAKSKENGSTDLVPHQVYLDRRSGPSHSNVTIVAVSVLAMYRETILGCEIDGIQSNNTKVVDIMLVLFVENYFPVTHTDCFVYCFDMKINVNSKVSVLYRRNGTVVKEPVRSDSVVIPPNNVREKDEVMVCAAGFGVVPHLDQWLKYQKTAGIKFIHINIEPSFLQNLNRSSTLVNFVKSGFVKMVVWQDYLNSSQVYYYSQSLKYHDCALRYQGIYKYMLVIDFDEYFIGYDRNTTIISYVHRLLAGQVGTVMLLREEYHCKLKNMSLPRDGNMTKLYDTSIHQPAPQGKCFHLVKSLYQNSVHAASLLAPYRIADYRWHSLKSRCYLAHLTHKTQGRKKCNN